ncbi:MAG: DUF2877 domain-containing protein [Nitrososphaeria archaeon]|nr:DUF2877 domain-containing protein [Nitrososphaeria archaeon]
MIIVTRKDNRSPHTINTSQDNLNRSFQSYVKVRDKVEVDDSYIRVGELEIELRDAEIYTPIEIVKIRDVDDSLEKLFWKGLNSIMILYSISSSCISILELDGFREFLKNVVYPFSRRNVEAVKRIEEYRALLGLGGGFTPSGDDFLLGFISIVNLVDEELQVPKIVLDEDVLFNYTNWVSGMFLKYAQHGLYDEHLHQLLTSLSLRDEEIFTDSLLQLVRRGHTSGLDISLGVVTGLASIIDILKSRGLTEKLIKDVLNISL